MYDSLTNILLIGLPQTGKSTYIGTLYYVLNNPDEISSEALELTTLDGDEKYIINLKDSWLKFKTVERTNFSEDHQIIRFNILNPVNQKTITLEIPDLSGEVFRRMFEEREKPKYLVPLIQEAIGYLLFVNCSNYIRATSISSALPHWEESKDEVKENETDLTNWEYKHVPTQVKIIEILQYLLLLKNKQHIKLNLVFSAWDVIREIYDYPKLFLEKEFPMLDQFLIANKDEIELEIFGISAQGCSYEKDVNPLDLSKKYKSAISRIQVLNGRVETNDLAVTLRNLLE